MQVSLCQNLIIFFILPILLGNEPFGSNLMTKVCNLPIDKAI